MTNQDQLTVNQRAMIEIISDISDDHYSAGWLRDIEHTVFNEIGMYRSSGYKSKILTDDSYRMLLLLAKATNSWPVFSVEIGDVICVDFNEYIPKYLAWKIKSFNFLVKTESENPEYGTVGDFDWEQYHKYGTDRIINALIARKNDKG